MSAPGMDPSQQAAQQAPAQPQMTPDGVRVANPAEVLNAQLDAAEVTARKAAAASSAAEAKDFANASLLLSQAVIVLDPSRSQGGTPLQHDVAIETIRQQGQAQVAQIAADAGLKAAQETAKAPTPAKERTVSVRRDGQGRASQYSVKG